MPKLITEQTQQVEKEVKERVRQLFAYFIDVFGEGIVDNALPFLGVDSNSQRAKVYCWRNGERIPSLSSRQNLAAALEIDVKDINSYLEGKIDHETLLKKIFKSKSKIPLEDRLHYYFPIKQLKIVSHDKDGLAESTFIANEDIEIEEYLLELEGQPVSQIIQEIKTLAREADRKIYLMQAIASRLESKLLQVDTNTSTESRVRDFDPTIFKSVVKLTLEVNKIDLEELAEEVFVKKEQIELLLEGVYPGIDGDKLDTLAGNLVKTQTALDIISFRSWDDIKEFCGF